MHDTDGIRIRRRSGLAAGVAAFALAASFTAHAGGVTQTFNVTASSTAAWTINGQSNPTLTLVRGGVYEFSLQGVSGIHPFYIKSTNSIGSGNAYNDGVTNNGTAGTIIIGFTVPATAPSSLHYNCFNHGAMNGVINVIDDVIFADNFED